MATQTGAFPFIGKYKGVIGYRIGDKHFFRSMPEKMTQTAATKRAAEDFGKASSCGKLIRQALHQVMDLKQPHYLTNHLNRIMAKVIRKGGRRLIMPEHLSMLKGFSFNRDTKVDSVLLGIQAFTEDQENISVSIPSIAKFKYTRNTTHIEIKAIAISTNFANGSYKQTISETVMINVRKPFEAMDLTMPRPGSEATIIILQVRACGEENGEMTVFNDKNYFAADIIAVLPPIPLIQIKANHKPKLKKIPLPAVTTKHYFGIPQLE